MNYKVKQEDLKGDIKDFPIEVVQKMVDEQVRQGNKADVTVFEYYKAMGVLLGGFEWGRSEDKEIFWSNVIRQKDFDLFFSKYPKQIDLKEDNSKADKVVVKEKKRAKMTFKKLSEVKLLVTNRNRKAVVAFLNEVCDNENKNWINDERHVLNNYDCYLYFISNDINEIGVRDINIELELINQKVEVKLRDIKRIYAREENRKQRELEKTKLFCETAEENVYHSESEVKKLQENTFLTNEAMEKIKEFIDKVGEIKSKIGEPISITCSNPLRDHVITREGVKYFSGKEISKIRNIDYLTSHNEYLKSKLDKEVKTNEELRKMIDGKIEVLEKREAQLTSLSAINSDLNIANEKLRDYNDVLENKLGKERLFRNIFILMFLISFLTLVSISLKY